MSRQSQIAVWREMAGVGNGHLEEPAIDFTLGLFNELGFPPELFDRSEYSDLRASVQSLVEIALASVSAVAGEVPS